MFSFLLVVHAIIAALLVTVILMQRSEGGGLTSGGSPSGLMSARGAADFLTRSTAVLAGLFIAMSIALAVIAANRQNDVIDTSLARQPAAGSTAPLTPGAGAPPVVDPLGQAAGNIAGAADAPATSNDAVPLAQ